MKPLTVIMTFLLSLIALLNIVDADVVYLKKGQAYEGKIIKEDDEKIALKTSIMTFILYKKEIKGIERFYPVKGSKMPEGERFDILDVLKGNAESKEKEKTKSDSKDELES